MPLSGIRRLHQSSGDFIASYSINGNAVIWLDYASPQEIGLQIQQYESLISKLQTYDVLKVTLNANPDALRVKDSIHDKEARRETAEERNEKRFEKLSSA